ncbi:flagellin [Pseudovibrio exalbescens]|uniref:flagellin N-terminal helical domain-containing protein n=1 Tax=Pseudovibrio exalbescens TaxID=197461 RepID=UPI002365A378|nr:flagellin [Pseudovibrio exalbescens]MDD7910955.1 flagellin [Pseudovibrio exalbescens]
MSSLLTNTSAMVALSTLRNINNDLADTQNRISTGMRVADASDNAAYWSIATTMNSDNEALSAVQDALGLGAATVDVAFTAMDSAVDVVSEIKAKLVAATDDGADKNKIQSDIKALQEQLQTIADSATFNGENWLSQDISTTPADAVKSVTGGFTRNAAGAAALQNITIDTTSIALIDTGGTTGILNSDMAEVTGAANIAGANMLDFDISGITDSAADQTALEALITAVDTKLGTMTDAATALGSAKSRIDMQTEFVKNLSDAVDRGVGQLVDADMNAESTRLQALQTQQQLGIQALSIANSGSQNILSLFR